MQAFWLHLQNSINSNENYMWLSYILRQPFFCGVLSVFHRAWLLLSLSNHDYNNGPNNFALDCRDPSFSFSQ